MRTRGHSRNFKLQDQYFLEDATPAGNSVTVDTNITMELRLGLRQTEMETQLESLYLASCGTSYNCIKSLSGGDTQLDCGNRHSSH